MQRRSPRGERGLKFLYDENLHGEGWSLPPRGAWIEIAFAWGLLHGCPCRSPRGERGLKYWQEQCTTLGTARSLPPRGAWIEILTLPWAMFPLGSLPPRGVWIEIGRSTMTAWKTSRLLPYGDVTPFPGSGARETGAMDLALSGKSRGNSSTPGWLLPSGRVSVSKKSVPFRASAG